MQVRKGISIILICIFAIVNCQSYIYAKETQSTTGSTSSSSKIKPIIDDKNKLITNIPFETTVEQFKEKISGKISLIQNAKGEDITKNKEAIITTGTIVTIDKKQYAVIVTGDLDGDGIYTYKDVLIEEDYLKKGSTERKNVTDIEQSGGHDTSMVSAPQSSKLIPFAKTYGSYQNQNFAITDIGTGNQIIWYGCNSKEDAADNNFIVRAYRGASAHSVGSKVGEIKFHGGGHQVFNVVKTSGGYHIYTGAYASRGPSNGTRYNCPPKGVAMTTITSSIPNGKTVELQNPSSGKAIRVLSKRSNAHVFAFGVDETVGKMVTSSTGGGGTYVYSLNKSNFSSSTKGKKITLGSGKETRQGACLVGKYYYIIEGQRR